MRIAQREQKRSYRRLVGAVLTFCFALVALLLILGWVWTKEPTSSGRCLEVEYLLAQPPRKARLGEFVKWAEANGAIISPDVALVDEHNGTGWGFRAVGKLREHETVVRIPKSIVLFAEDEGSYVFSLAKQVLASLTDSPYVKSLPWEDACHVELNGDLAQSVKAAHDALDESLPLSLFETVVQLVVSRVHLVGSTQYTLIPLADMFNTSPQASFLNVHCGYETDRTIECKTTREVRSGEALLVGYRTLQGNLVSNDALKDQYAIRDV